MRFLGKVDLHEDTVESMLAAASILQLSEVTKACCAFLKKQLHPSNCIGICLFADRQSCIDLKKAAQSYTAVSCARGSAVFLVTRRLADVMIFLL